MTATAVASQWVMLTWLILQHKGISESVSRNETWLQSQPIVFIRPASNSQQPYPWLLSPTESATHKARTGQGTALDSIAPDSDPTYTWSELQPLTAAGTRPAGCPHSTPGTRGDALRPPEC